jgi:hypothetical protein
MRERCDPIFITLLKPTLTEHTNKIKWILFFLYILHIEGASELSCGLIRSDGLYLDPIRHPSATRCPTIALWRYCVRPRRFCSDRGSFLEVHPHAGALQPDHGKRDFAHLYCMCEHERCESDRHDGHVVQVSPDPMYSRIEVTEFAPRSLLFTGLLINRSKVKPWLQWLHTVSFFHAAFEALAVNELRFLQLKEDKVSDPLLYDERH